MPEQEPRDPFKENRLDEMYHTRGGRRHELPDGDVAIALLLASSGAISIATWASGEVASGLPRLAHWIGIGLGVWTALFSGLLILLDAIRRRQGDRDV